MTNTLHLCGHCGAGKTSIRSLIVSPVYDSQGSSPDDKTNMLGDMKIRLWDCGGPEMFMAQFTIKHLVAKPNDMLLYVFSVDGPLESDLHYFRQYLNKMEPDNPCSVVAFIHKMDLISPEKRLGVVSEWTSLIRQAAAPRPIQIFTTTIWDHSLFAAVSSILHQRLSDRTTLLDKLQHFCQVSDADELIVFDRWSCFMMARVVNSLFYPQQHHHHSVWYAEQDQPEEDESTERVSAYLRKITMSARQTFLIAKKRFPGNPAEITITGMEIKKKDVVMVLDHFTSVSLVALVYKTHVKTEISIIKTNISAARPYFEKLIKFKTTT